MKRDIVNTKESDVKIYNTKEENNFDDKNLNINQKSIEISNTQVGSKLLSFIKANPILFTLIVISTCAVIITSIVVPVVIINKNKNDSKGDENTTGTNNYQTDNNFNDNNENNNGDNGNNNNYINDELPNLDNIINIDSSKLFNFNNIDTIYNDISAYNTETFDQFCSYLSGKSTILNDYQKVYLIYQWVAKNIAYDYDSYKANILPNCEPRNVYSSKLTVCSGYSRLFTELLKCLNFQAENIQNIIGHSKGLGFDIEKELTDENTDHEWNAVKLEENWCLIDTTWGAGQIKNEVFQESYSEYYLCTPPKQFVRTHLPRTTQEQYQNLESPINTNTFKYMVKTTNYFFEYGFIGLANDKAIQNFCGGGKFILKYEGERPILSIKIKKNIEIDYWIMQEKITNGYIIIFYINEEGNYNLEIGARKREESDYHSILNFQIKCSSTPNIKKYFPTFTQDYQLDDSIKLIFPINNELIQGEKYNFKIESSYEQLFLLIGNEGNFEFIEMNKEGNYFIENNVLIHGNKVKISHKIDNTDNYMPLVEYITKGETINFPSSYLAPFKKRLENPLESNLRIGESYNFKIICDIDDEATYDIYLYDGSLISLNKEGNIYSKTINIKSGISQFNVIYGPVSTDNYIPIYSFTVS